MFEKIKNRLKTKNDGYSLVELIIVIAIMAVLASLAMVTVSSISTAKATSAKDTFNDELSQLLTYTRSQSGGTKGEYAMLVKKTDESKFIIQFGFSDDGASFTQDSSIDEVILDRCVIYYKSNASTDGMGDEISENGILIKFNKSDGSVYTGSGVYTFCKQGSENSVGKVTLNKSSGSHYTGS